MLSGVIVFKRKVGAGKLEPGWMVDQDETQ